MESRVQVSGIEARIVRHRTRREPWIETDDGGPRAGVLEVLVQSFGFGRGWSQYHRRLGAVVFGHQTGGTGHSRCRAGNVHRSTDRF